MSDEGFLGRWSRRKLEVLEQEKKDLLPAPTQESGGGAMAALVPAASPHPGLPPEGEGETPTPPPLTLADAASLTIDSDFKPFLAKAVAADVKNAALRKLFADPHFNVMDRLDIYIDDYSNPAPLPESTLRQMASAKFLNLFQEEEPEAVPAVAQSDPAESPPSPPVAVADATQPASQEHDAHQDADLRLQPDDAARAEDARRGAG
ncbi:DUF3306 domain-containing protein [Variovorax sp. J22G21]|uniref:DUF3306 domain-containing protein n=1 Tax=Variovorax fucosicus TaxID=3053517 RepID=UPI002576CD45|nr:MULTISPECIES: DUF3306 domain-containing protein [unclassified Variovorax]MDM0038056.1 DUF3306 domain-containing protein [Variovorax sp. J22R193]MDM0062832.1 DUF3306 domain-containing protein [Variovorax sp. J22G21]